MADNSSFSSGWEIPGALTHSWQKEPGLGLAKTDIFDVKVKIPGVSGFSAKASSDLWSLFFWLLAMIALGVVLWYGLPFVLKTGKGFIS